MRVAVVRSDVGNVYLNDVENSSQRCFSSEPYGQSRYLSKPSDSALQAVISSLIPTSGVSLSNLKNAIYPESNSGVDVRAATLTALGSVSSLPNAKKEAWVKAIQDLVAPLLVETGPVLLSFAYGTLSKLSSSSYQPGAQWDAYKQEWVPNARAGSVWYAGKAVVCLSSDNYTDFSL